MSARPGGRYARRTPAPRSSACSCSAVAPSLTACSPQPVRRPRLPRRSRSGGTSRVPGLPLFGATPTASISPSSVVKTLVDAVLPRSFGRTWPNWLTNVLRYSLPSNAPVRAAIGSTVVHGPTIQVSNRSPIRSRRERRSRIGHAIRRGAGSRRTTAQADRPLTRSSGCAT